MVMSNKATLPLLLVLVLVLLGAVTTSSGEPVTQLTVSYDQVPTTQPTAVSSQADTFSSCVCDLTAFECDMNCRCDSDCTATEIATFSGTAFTGAVTVSVPTCVDPDLVTVNTRGGITTTLENNLLCVKEDNNPTKGTFFDEPSALISMPDLLNQATDRFGKVTATPSLATRFLVKSSSTYSVGDNVRMYYNAARTPNMQLFPLPTRGYGGECVDLNAPKYRIDVPSGPDARCVRYSANLATACATAWDGEQYVSALIQVLPTAGSTTASVSVTLRSVKTMAADGSLTTVATPTIASIQPTYAAPNCANALKSIHFEFQHDDAGTITGVQADVIVMAQLVGVANAAGTITGTLTQEFTASWTASAAARPRSGNPGYLIGKPVIAGALQTQPGGTKQAVSQFLEGLTLLQHTAAGACSTTGTEAHQVLFGQDMHASCSVSYTFAQLKAACEAATTSMGVAQYTNLTLSSLDLMIGQFGSSRWNVTSEWVEMAKSDIEALSDAAQTHATLWSSNPGVCQNVVSGVKVEFLTANVGNVLNPQRKILYARATRVTTNWRFTGYDQTVAQEFPITVDVAFVNIENGQLSNLVPPAPPLFPELPSDILYPLAIDDSAAHTRHAAPPATAALTAMLLAVALAVWRRTLL